jgi:hypothetical protein
MSDSTQIDVMDYDIANSIFVLGGFTKSTDILSPGSIQSTTLLQTD